MQIGEIHPPKFTSIAAAYMVVGVVVGIGVDNLSWMSFSKVALRAAAGDAASSSAPLYAPGASSTATDVAEQTQLLTQLVIQLAQLQLQQDATGTSTTAPSTSQNKYAYKLVSDVDPCTMNKLGADGWTPIQYGSDSSGNSQYTESAGGKDEHCTHPGIYSDFIWILFQKALTQ